MQRGTSSSNTNWHQMVHQFGRALFLFGGRRASPRIPWFHCRLVRVKYVGRYYYWGRYFSENFYWSCQYQSVVVPYSNIHLAQTLYELSKWQRRWINTYKYSHLQIFLSFINWRLLRSYGQEFITKVEISSIEWIVMVHMFLFSLIHCVIFKTCYQYAGDTEWNHDKSLSTYPFVWPRLEPRALPRYFTVIIINIYRVFHDFRT